MLLPRKTTWAIVAVGFLAFFGVSTARAETIFNENFEAYTVGLELEDTYLWTDDTGTNKHLISDTGSDGHSAYFSNVSTSKSAYSYFSLETYGRVKWCFDYQTYHGYSLWQIYSGTDIVAYWRLGDTAYDPAGSPLMYATSTSHYSDDLAYVVSEAIIPVCIYYDPTTYETAATIGGQYFHNTIPYNGNHGQPTRFEIRDYNYSVTARYSRYDNMTVDSDVPDFADYGNEDVEVIENPDYDPDAVIEIWSEDFRMSTKICYFGTPCEWSFNYSKDYDNGTAYLLYDQDPRSRSEAIASTTLPLVPIRTNSFTVPEPGSPGTYNYCVFLEIATTSELYLSCGHQLNWYEENTEITNHASSTDLAAIGWFINKITNVFPLSIAKQIWSIFAAAREASTTPAILYLQDILPDQGDAILGGTNPVLLSYALLQANLPIWDTIVLRFMNYCVYTIGFFICLFLIFPKLRGIDLGGHNKVPGPENDGTIHAGNTVRSLRDIRPAKVGHTADLRYKYPKGVTDLRYK